MTSYQIETFMLTFFLNNIIKLEPLLLSSTFSSALCYKPCISTPFQSENQLTDHTPCIFPANFLRNCLKYQLKFRSLLFRYISFCTSKLVSFALSISATGQKKKRADLLQPKCTFGQKRNSSPFSRDLFTIKNQSVKDLKQHHLNIFSWFQSLNQDLKYCTMIIILQQLGHYHFYNHSTFC